MKSSGRLVASLVMVGVLVAASITAFVVGIRPLLTTGCAQLGSPLSGMLKRPFST